MFPQADIFMLVYDPAAVDSIKAHKLLVRFCKNCRARTLPSRALRLSAGVEQLRLDAYDW